MSYVSIIVTTIVLTIIVSCIINLIFVRRLVNMIIDCFKQQDEFDKNICSHINRMYDIIIFNGLKRPVKKGENRNEDSSSQ